MRGVTTLMSSGELRGRGITEETSNRMSSANGLLGIITQITTLVEANTLTRGLR